MAKRKHGRSQQSARIVVIILMLLVIALCLVAMLVPQIDVWTQQSQVNDEISAWKERIAVVPTQPQATDPAEETLPTEPPYQDLKAAMEAYNEEIFENGQEKLVDAWSYQADVFDLSDYGVESEIAGLVIIPKIDLEFPLYLGASYAHLNNGFGQLSQTSMPIGGENTNCVIAGHRGWGGMPYMRDIEELEVGDPVYIQNLWETLEYRVVEAMAIWPNEIDKVLIQPGRDLVTLVTCHPLGSTSQRYVLFCERYIEEPEAETVTEPTAGTAPTADITWNNRVTITSSEGLDFESSRTAIFMTTQFPWICMGVVVLLLLAAAIILLHSHRKQDHSKDT